MNKEYGGIFEPIQEHIEEIKDRVLERWNEPHRFYHNMQHFKEIKKAIDRSSVSAEEKGILLVAALYHDAVYEIGAKDNEQKSADLFLEDFTGILTPPTINRVHSIIMDTASRKMPTDPLSRTFWLIDNEVLGRDFEGLLEWERQIFKEYQKYPIDEYKKARIEFIESEIENNYAICNVQGLKDLCAYIRAFKPKIGIYPGTFAPFHIGHLNVLQKAEKIFDKVILVRGNNPEKNVYKSGVADENFPMSLRNREIIVWDGMTYKLLEKKEQEGADVCLIRGLRNGKDLDYEVNRLRFVEDFKEINVVYIQCDRSCEHISSSAINSIALLDEELAKKYLPS